MPGERVPTSPTLPPAAVRVESARVRWLAKSVEGDDEAAESIREELESLADWMDRDLQPRATREWRLPANLWRQRLARAAGQPVQADQLGAALEAAIASTRGEIEARSDRPVRPTGHRRGTSVRGGTGPDGRPTGDGQAPVGPKPGAGSGPPAVPGDGAGGQRPGGQL